MCVCVCLCKGGCRWWDVTNHITVNSEGKMQIRLNRKWHIHLRLKHCDWLDAHLWLMSVVSVLWVTGERVIVSAKLGHINSTHKQRQTHKTACVRATVNRLSSPLDLWDSMVNMFSLQKRTFWSTQEPQDGLASWWNGMKYQQSTENMQQEAWAFWLC